MPWDSDIDVQISSPSLTHLATHYNMTVFPFTPAPWLYDVAMPPQTSFSPPPNPDTPTTSPESYLLEINPHHTNPSPTDTHNLIDARWISLSTGLYIDITAVHPDPQNTSLLFCKDGHKYLTEDIFPLRTSTFEGVPVKVPFRYQEVLGEEYGEGSLVETRYWREGYVFDGGEWRVMTGEERGRSGGVMKYNRWERGKRGGGRQGLKA